MFEFLDQSKAHNVILGFSIRDNPLIEPRHHILVLLVTITNNDTIESNTPFL